MEGDALIEHILTADLSGIGRGCKSSYDSVTSVGEAHDIVAACEAFRGSRGGSVLVCDGVEEGLDHVGEPFLQDSHERGQSHGGEGHAAP